MHFLLLSSRVQQLPQQPWLCPPGSLPTRSSSPAKVSNSLSAARLLLQTLPNSLSHDLCAASTLPGQILQVVRAPNGAQYIIPQPQQQILLQQQMQPGGVQAPVIQQVGRPVSTGEASTGGGSEAWLSQSVFILLLLEMLAAFSLRLPRVF